MEEKSGYSKRVSDIRVDHFDDNDLYIGYSELRTNNFGDKVWVHYDKIGNQTGESEDRHDFWGDKIRVHHDDSGNFIGTSEKNTDSLGDKSLIHKDSDGHETGRSVTRTDFVGDKRQVHYKRDAPVYGNSESGGSTNEMLGKLLGGILVLVAAIWFIFSIVLPLLVVNLPLLLLIGAFATSATTRRILALLSFLSLGYECYDWYRGVFFQQLPETWSAFSGLMLPLFVLNVIAACLSGYIFLNSVISSKIEDTDKLKKYNLGIGLLMVLFGVSLLLVSTAYFTPSYSHSSESFPDNSKFNTPSYSTSNGNTNQTNQTVEQSGGDTGFETTCLHCSGRGYIDSALGCSNCVNGKVSCPDCGGGKWQKLVASPDCSFCFGTMKRVCPDCKNQSKTNCGECNQSGEVPCSFCSGVGYSTCDVCDGTSRKQCSSCGGKGQVATGYGTEQVNGKLQNTKRYESCNTCLGSGKMGCTNNKCQQGKIACTHCNVTGKMVCPKCHGLSGKVCSKCNGSGVVECDCPRFLEDCKTCNAGFIACTKCMSKITCSVCNGSGRSR